MESLFGRWRLVNPLYVLLRHMNLVLLSANSAAGWATVGRWLVRSRPPILSMCFMH